MDKDRRNEVDLFVSTWINRKTSLLIEIGKLKSNMYNMYNITSFSQTHT